MNIRLPLNRWTLTGLVFAICSLVIWEQIALFKLADACEVSLWICWIPGVATGGVMLASTALHMTPELNQRIRTYAGRLAAGGITGGIIGTGVQEYINAAHMDPSPWLALPVGGIPVLQGGLLVHLLSMVFAQARSERVAAEKAELQRQSDARAAADAERDQQARVARESAEHDRQLARQRELAIEIKRAADEKARLAAEAARLAAETEKRTEAARAALSSPRLKLAGGTDVDRRKTGSTVQARAIAWLHDQHNEGRDYTEIGPTEIAKAINANPETCRKGHQKWKASLTELLEAAG